MALELFRKRSTHRAARVSGSYRPRKVLPHVTLEVEDGLRISGAIRCAPCGGNVRDGFRLVE